MNKKVFGFLDTGATVHKFTIKNLDTEATVMTYGATLTELKFLGRDVLCGYDTLDDYVIDDSHQGGIIGRVANRIKNAEITVDEKLYSLTKNDGENCLHGGNGFDRRVWNVVDFCDTGITLSYISKDFEEGFPSSVEATVTYSIDERGALKIDYLAIPDGKTPIAMTNHAYFNLNEIGTDVLSHTAMISADRYTEVDTTLIPTGNRPSVEGTALDFRKETEIGKRIGEVGMGYDHNFILSHSPEKYDSLPLAAKVCGEKIKMSVYTDQPGIQFYTGNFLCGEPDFKGGRKRIKHGAFCLEAQTEPGQAKIYSAGEEYRQTTIYKLEKR